MPLTQNQINAINGILTGENSIEVEINDLLSARDDIRALLRTHEDIIDVDATVVLAKAKLRAITALNALTTKLS